MTEMLMFLVGSLVGGGLIYAWQTQANAHERAERQRLETQLGDLLGTHERELLMQKTAYEERIKDLQNYKMEMATTFKATAAQVLEQNAKQFHEVAEKDLRQVKTEATGELEQRRQAIDTTIKELREQLRLANEKISTFEKERTDQYSQVLSGLRHVYEQGQNLSRETQTLRAALTTSQAVRGRWGEMVLKNILQTSGLHEGIDFSMQFSTNNDDGDRLRPDCIVHLPNSEHVLAIDAKTSLFDSYLEAERAATDEERRAAHEEFVVRLRERVRDLAGKSYEKFVTSAVPYVVMFVPSEAAIRAAFDADPELFPEAMAKRVVIASPATIIPLILLVAQARQQFTFSQAAHELYEVVTKLGQRLELFVSRLGKVQNGLDQASRAWNDAIEKSWHGQQGVLRTVERARQLGGQLPENMDIPQAPGISSTQIAEMKEEGSRDPELS